MTRTPAVVTPPLEAVIVVEPTSLAVTTPSAIDATDGLDEAQLIPLLPSDRLSLV